MRFQMDVSLLMIDDLEGSKVKVRNLNRFVTLKWFILVKWFILATKFVLVTDRKSYLGF